MAHSPLAPDVDVDRQLAFSPAQAAEVLSISRGLIYELLASGEITGRKIGKRTVITRSELVRYLDSLPAYQAAS
jgi:excisionase family DNA binding protein